MRALITIALIAAIGVFGFIYFGDMDSPVKVNPTTNSNQSPTTTSGSDANQTGTRQSTSQKPLSLVEQLSLLNGYSEDEKWVESANLVDQILAKGFADTPLQDTDISDLKTDFAEIYHAAGRTPDAITIMEGVMEQDRSSIEQLDPHTLEPDDPENYERYSFIRQHRADRAQKLGDWYFETGAFEKAYDSYFMAQLDRESQTIDFGSFPDKKYLIDQRIEAARNGNMKYSVYCLLRDEYSSVDWERAQEKPLQFWGESEFDRCPQASHSYSADEFSEPNFETVKIFYGTSRNHTGKRNVEKTFGGDRASLTTGSIEMTVPLDREIGTIQIPGLLSFGGAKDGVHIVLTRINPSNSNNAFRAELGNWVDENPAPKKEAFIYVHGHAVSFANAARRAAQLSVDLDMRHGGMFYSWPAGSNALRYFKSQENVDHAAAELQKYLKEVSAVNNIDELHIIAHSMGNDVLSKALGDLELEGYTAENRPFGQIIWASPDVDASDFSRRIAAFKSRQIADGMTLYASSKDKALSVSKWIWDNFPRAGQAPPVTEVARIIETVDTSDIDRNPSDILAHGDYASAAIDDMRAVIWLSLVPGKRCSLTKKTIDGVDYWTASKKTANCDKPTFRSAVSIARNRLYPDLQTQSRPVIFSAPLNPIGNSFAADPIEPVGPVRSDAEVLADQLLDTGN